MAFFRLPQMALGGQNLGLVIRLTFELSGRRRQATRPGPVKMYTVPPARAWWPAVGAPLERGVRPHSRPHWQAVQASGLGQAANKVGVLHGLASSPFAEIVNNTHRNHEVALRVGRVTDEREV